MLGGCLAVLLFLFVVYGSAGGGLGWVYMLTFVFGYCVFVSDCLMVGCGLISLVCL